MEFLRGKLRGKTPSWGRESDVRGETDYTNIFILNTLYPHSSLTLQVQQEGERNLALLPLVQDHEGQAGEAKQLGLQAV